MVVVPSSIMSETCQNLLCLSYKNLNRIEFIASFVVECDKQLAGNGSLPVEARRRISPRTSERDDALDPGICWQAITSRDARFDGRFFVGATTTGLYCRNICPVPPARQKNVRLFACAAAAEAAGFRPCKRCQPQAAPGTPAWVGTSAVVSRAFRLIMEGALNHGSVAALAGRLGLGPRHLHRLFVQHLGASPLRIAVTHRVHLASKLIEESGLAMTEVAFGSGFKSVREFNHAIRLSTGQSPREIRRAGGGPISKSMRRGLELRLPYREPFDWPSLIAFLRSTAIPGVEAISEDSYKRTIEVNGAPGVLTVRPGHGDSQLIIQLHANNYHGLAETVERVRRMFDLSADPVRIASHLCRDKKLRSLIRQRPGLRVPGVWDGFEVAVLSVLGQKLSSRNSNPLVGRFVRMFGAPVNTSVCGLTHLFPKPEILGLADLSKAGISDARSKAIRKICSPAARKELKFATAKTLEQSISRLEKTCGVDESIANYIAMRAFGEPDAFPSGEWGLRQSVSESGAILPPVQVLAMAESWRPWRAYAAMHIVAGGCR
jgi:AraC family transcriptional regulator of adaptative response / DNA-3-methyladenine glycosylase II